MASLNINRNFQVLPPIGPLPSGEYLSIITASEIKKTKSGTGEYASFEWQVLDGPYEGRKFWSRHTTDNQKEMAVTIGLNQLEQLSKACGLPAIPQDTDELHNIPVIARVEFLPANPAKNRDMDSNEVKAFKAAPRGGQAAAAPSAARQSAPAPTPAASSAKAMPWNK